jgi:hypothetical protein
LLIRDQGVFWQVAARGVKAAHSPDPCSSPELCANLTNDDSSVVPDCTFFGQGFQQQPPEKVGLAFFGAERLDLGTDAARYTDIQALTKNLVSGHLFDLMLTKLR